MLAPGRARHRLPLGLAETGELRAGNALQKRDRLGEALRLRQLADIAADALQAARLDDRADVVEDGAAYRAPGAARSQAPS